MNWTACSTYAHVIFAKQLKTSIYREFQVRLICKSYQIENAQ
jgi:hypothetical protein